MAVPGQVTLNAPARVSNPMAGINLATRNAMLSNQMLADTIGDIGSTYAKAQERGKEQAGKRTTADIIAQIQSMGTDIASARAIENNPMFSEAGIRGQYTEYGDQIDMGAINEAITGNVTTRRNEVIESVMGSADQIASDTGSVAEGAENMRQSLIDSGVSGVEANKASNTYASNREQTQSLFDTQYRDTISALGAEYNPADEATNEANFTQAKLDNPRLKRADWDALMVKESAAARDAQILAETMGPQQTRDYNADVTGFTSDVANTQYDYDQKVQTAIAKRDSYALPSDTTVAKYSEQQGGLVASLTESFGLNSTAFKWGGNDITEEINTLRAGGLSPKDINRLIVAAFESNPAAQNPNSSVDLWGLLGLDKSALRAGIKQAKGSLSQFNEANAQAIEATNIAEKYRISSVGDIADFKKKHSRKVLGLKQGAELDPGGILRQTLLDRQQDTESTDTPPEETAFEKQKRLSLERASNNPPVSTPEIPVTPSMATQNIIQPTTGQQPVTEGRTQYPAMSESRANQLAGDFIQRGYRLGSTIPRAAGRGVSNIWDRLRSDAQGQKSISIMRNAEQSGNTTGYLQQLLNTSLSASDRLIVEQLLADLV